MFYVFASLLLKTYFYFMTMFATVYFLLLCNSIYKTVILFYGNLYYTLITKLNFFLKHLSKKRKLLLQLLLFFKDKIYFVILTFYIYKCNLSCVIFFRLRLLVINFMSYHKVSFTFVLILILILIVYNIIC